MEQTPAAVPDPAERWRRLPVPPRAEDWITEHDVDPVPGSISSGSASFDGRVPFGDSADDGD